MKCFEHNSAEAVAQCGRCGVFLCKKCEESTKYRIANKALCLRCNSAIERERACVFHENEEAKDHCGKCGSKICSNCISKTVFNIDNKALCLTCNKQIADTRANELQRGVRIGKIKLIVWSVLLLASIVMLVLGYLQFPDNNSALLIGGALGLWGFSDAPNSWHSIRKMLNRPMWRPQPSIRREVKAAIDPGGALAEGCLFVGFSAIFGLFAIFAVVYFEIAKSTLLFPFRYIYLPFELRKKIREIRGYRDIYESLIGT